MGRARGQDGPHEASTQVPFGVVRGTENTMEAGAGARLEPALEFAGVQVGSWMELAQDRLAWKQAIAGIRDIDSEVKVYVVLERKAGVV